MAAKRTPGLGLIIVGALLLLVIGPLGAIALWYLVPDHPKISIVAMVGAQVMGVALIAVGAIRNSRSNLQPMPPPISN